MGSEDQVLELMALLDTGLLQANKMEEKLTEYERKLQVNFHTFSVLAKPIESVLSVHLSVCPGSYLENEINNSHCYWCWNLFLWDSLTLLKVGRLKWA